MMSILFWASLAWAAIVMAVGSIGLLCLERASSQLASGKREIDHGGGFTADLTLRQNFADDLDATITRALSRDCRSFRSWNERRILPPGDVIRDIRLTRPFEIQDNVVAIEQTAVMTSKGCR